MRRTHHDAFEHSLSPNQRLFSAFKSGQKLNRDKEA
jgi:hypothetical protein